MKLGFTVGCFLVIFLLRMESQEVMLRGDFRSIGYFAIIMAILALSMVVYTFRDFKLRRMAFWPHAQGRIEDVRVEKGFLGVDRIYLTYFYSVKDREYTNDIYDFSQEFATPGQIKMHPELRGAAKNNELVGRLIKVYYNPECPWRSAISRKVGQSDYITIIPAIIVILFSAYSLIKIGALLI